MAELVSNLRALALDGARALVESQALPTGPYHEEVLWDMANSAAGRAELRQQWHSAHRNGASLSHGQLAVFNAFASVFDAPASRMLAVRLRLVLLRAALGYNSTGFLDHAAGLPPGSTAKFIRGSFTTLTPEECALVNRVYDFTSSLEARSVARATLLPLLQSRGLRSMAATALAAAHSHAVSAAEMARDAAALQLGNSLHGSIGDWRAGRHEQAAVALAAAHSHAVTAADVARDAAALQLGNSLHWSIGDWRAGRHEQAAVALSATFSHAVTAADVARDAAAQQLGMSLHHQIRSSAHGAPSAKSARCRTDLDRGLKLVAYCVIYGMYMEAQELRTFSKAVSVLLHTQAGREEIRAAVMAYRRQSRNTARTMTFTDRVLAALSYGGGHLTLACMEMNQWVSGDISDPLHAVQLSTAEVKMLLGTPLDE